MARFLQIVGLLGCIGLCISPAAAQRDRGELQIEVHDPQGAVLSASGELVSEVNQFHLNFTVGDDGRYAAQDLAFGVYRLSLSRSGFVPTVQMVEIRSMVPQHLALTLGLKPVETQMQVSETATLIDPSRTNAVYTIGAQTIGEEMSSRPGRGTLDVVNNQPGWLYESNGVLHPRGSEYDVQFVMDGLPLTENRSLGYAPPIESNEVESMRVMTSGFPAEYGRKLGGVVEVTSPKNNPSGLHGEFTAEGGSFSSASGDGALSYSSGENRFSITGNGFHTDRYLDPPVLQNYTNIGNAGGFSSSYERDFSNGDRLFFTFVQHAVRYEVPNELVQQEAGQRQDSKQKETSGRVQYSHAFSPDILLSVAGSVRDVYALLNSNPDSTPVIVSQDRGYREGYARADLAGHHGRHEWKIGLDGIFSSVNENLQYQITDPTQFDAGTALTLAPPFSDHRWDIEPSAYVQDQIRLGKWNISAGLRFDHYGFVVNESAWSPRVAVSRFISPLNLLVHASYDRVFQTPAMENLLLASSPQLNSVSSLVVRLPVEPARANYYEVGFTKSFAGKLRIDGNVFRRDFRNYSDDDVLFDTGVSFPIAFLSAVISGEEIQIAVPRWGRFSGVLSYSNQTGTGQGPITGGLFLGSDTEGISDTSKFPVSQDQRNTLRANVRFQAMERLWFATSADYGSGLPADLGGPPDPGEIDFLLQQYGPAILKEVNFDLGRVRPNFSLNVAAGATLFHREGKEVSLEIEGHNLTNKVNVINFASLFSGTAVAPQASVGARLKVGF
ncbi:MAG TPA: TonB-dependent receptor [Candidatus Acidoferrales bacterium]|nr:TonB-dependent receptor [Candidatus Acidoferrales bacterium]